MKHSNIENLIIVDDLIQINMMNGFSKDDSVGILYADAYELKKGNKEFLVKYKLNCNPVIAGKYILNYLKKKEKETPGYIPQNVLKLKSVKRQKIITDSIIYAILGIVSIIVFFPIFLVLINSFKENSFIQQTAFAFPNSETFVGMTNFINGFTKSRFGNALIYSLVITVVSTLFILLFTSMTAWFLTRVKTWWSKVIYYVIIFSMVVPFQMVMLPMKGIANYLYLDNIFGIILIYVGFGAGLSVFMYAGFVKSVPLEIEEAALIDGCNPPQTFFKIVLPILKPTTITIAVLNVMWIWNDYLLPYQVLGTNIGKTTIPVAIQMAMSGSYGAIEYGSFMAMMLLTIIPVIIFYLFGQKYIIKGVTAGAVKG